MVNASLNWASIVGIVLAVGGAFLYFMRNFKPALARDYDVFFAAVGLLCGGILFFQGWRLDPILQFGQFLLAGTTVFFAYESVRLRGVTTEQARRSSFFEDEEPAPFRPRGGLGGGRDWDQDAERFAEPEPIRRRIPTRDDDGGEDFYRPRRPSRAAIPERAASRRGGEIDDWDRPRREPTGGRPERGGEGRIGEARDVEPGDRPRADAPSRYGTNPSRTGDFGARRRDREVGSESRRGSRPVASTESMPRSSRRPGDAGERPSGRSFGSEPLPNGVPQGSPLASSGRPAAGVSDADFSPLDGQPSRSRPQPPASGASGPASRPSGPALDNTSRFDD